MSNNGVSLPRTAIENTFYFGASYSVQQRLLDLFQQKKGSGQGNWAFVQQKL